MAGKAGDSSGAVNMDVLVRWMTEMAAKLENMATRELQEIATQQDVSMAQLVENFKAAMSGVMEAVEARVNSRTNEDIPG